MTDDTPAEARVMAPERLWMEFVHDGRRYLNIRYWAHKPSTYHPDATVYVRADLASPAGTTPREAARVLRDEIASATGHWLSNEQSEEIVRMILATEDPAHDR